MLKSRKRALLGAVAALCAAAAITATAVIAQNPPAAPSEARPLAEWFEILDTGDVPPAAERDRLQAVVDVANARAAGYLAEPSADTARVAGIADNGRPILVRAAGNRACVNVPDLGGTCWVSGDEGGPASPPALVIGPGQDAPVERSAFIALVGDGVDTITVEVEGDGERHLKVVNNVVSAELPGRALSWSWTDPDGTTHTEKAPAESPTQQGTR